MKFTGDWPIIYRVATPTPCAPEAHSFPHPCDRRCRRCGTQRDVEVDWAEYNAALATIRHVEAAIAGGS